MPLPNKLPRQGKIQDTFEFGKGILSNNMSPTLPNVKWPYNYAVKSAIDQA